MLGFVRFPISILVELLFVLLEILLFGRGIDLVDIEGRDDGDTLFELLRELCLLAEPLDDDLDVDDLRPCLDANTGSVKITATSTTTSIKFRLNLDFFIIKSRKLFFLIYINLLTFILSKKLYFVK